MSITKSQATNWSARVKVEAQDTSIVGVITDGSYQIDSIGAKTIKVIGLSDPTINTYVPGAGLTYEKLTDNEIDIDLDQMHDFAIEINEVEVAQSTPDFVPPAISRAGYLLALKADSFVLGSNTYANSSIPADNKFGTLAAPIALTTANIEEYLDKMATALAENSVGAAYCVLNPRAMSLIRRAGFATVTDNSAMWAGRTVSAYAGLTIIESNQVVKEATADGYQIMAFSPRAIPFAATVQKVETLMNPDDFGELIRGLYVFGAEVVYPKEISVLSGSIA